MFRRVVFVKQVKELRYCFSNVEASGGSYPPFSSLLTSYPKGFLEVIEVFVFLWAAYVMLRSSSCYGIKLVIPSKAVLLSILGCKLFRLPVCPCAATSLVNIYFSLSCSFSSIIFYPCMQSVWKSNKPVVFTIFRSTRSPCGLIGEKWDVPAIKLSDRVCSPASSTFN